MKLVATVIASIVAALGVVGVVWPDGLLMVGRELSTPVGIYAAAALRILLGTSLLICAQSSHAPNALRVIGVLVLIAGLVTLVSGPGLANQLVSAFSDQPELWQRFAAAVAVAVATFIVWALSPRAGPPGR